MAFSLWPSAEAGIFNVGHASTVDYQIARFKEVAMNYHVPAFANSQQPTASCKLYFETFYYDTYNFYGIPLILMIPPIS